MSDKIRSGDSSKKVSSSNSLVNMMEKKEKKMKKMFLTPTGNPSLTPGPGPDGSTSRAQRETKTVTKTDLFSISRKPTNLLAMSGIPIPIPRDL
jgi:hypothetical protein